jgi:FlaA1/EpsC-like NDP-sugar epimerase
MPLGEPMKKKTVLITGGTGSLGQALAFNLAKTNHVRIYSRNEEKQFYLSEKFKKNNLDNFSFVIGDIQDSLNMKKAMHGVNIIIHTAAMKDLIYCEKNPDQCIKNNIIGSQVLLNAASQTGSVERICGISTDKAAAPSSTYGASKLIMESIFYDFSKIFPNIRTTVARFGNMIDSSGSLISYWVNNPKSIYGLSDPNISRFFFTINEAIELVNQVVSTGKSGTVTIPFMKKIQIKDVIQKLSPQKVKNITGIKPGEKISEHLISSDELLFASIGKKVIVLSREEKSFLVKKIDPKVSKNFDSSTADSFSNSELDSILLKLKNKS